MWSTACSMSSWQGPSGGAGRLSCGLSQSGLFEPICPRKALAPKPNPPLANATQPPLQEARRPLTSSDCTSPDHVRQAVASCQLVWKRRPTGPGYKRRLSGPARSVTLSRRNRPMWALMGRMYRRMPPSQGRLLITQALPQSLRVWRIRHFGAEAAPLQSS